MKKDFFKKIDTEEKAYWLGFLYADGCVSQNLKVIILDLSIKDKDQIYKFRDVLESNHKVVIHGDNKQFIRIAISCKELGTDLMTLGCVPKKSLVLKFPTDDIVPIHLIRHFVRGYFDGDGSLCLCEGYRKRNDRNPENLYHYRIWFLKFVGTNEFLLRMKDYFHLDIGVYNEVNGKNCYNLKSGRKQKIIEILNILYEDSTVYLERKYQIYLKLLTD